MRFSISICACAWYATPRANASVYETLCSTRLPFEVGSPRIDIIGSSGTGASKRPRLLTGVAACNAASADDTTGVIG